MTLKECYASIGGDYESVTARLSSEAFVKKFLFKFLNDDSYNNLISTMQAEDYKEAFRAAHTIKGICQNLCLGRLLDSSSALTEALRNERSEEYSECLEKVKTDYVQTVACIKELQKEDMNA